MGSKPEDRAMKRSLLKSIIGLLWKRDSSKSLDDISKSQKDSTSTSFSASGVTSLTSDPTDRSVDATEDESKIEDNESKSDKSLFYDSSTYPLADLTQWMPSRTSNVSDHSYIEDPSTYRKRSDSASFSPETTIENNFDSHTPSVQARMEESSYLEFTHSVIINVHRDSESCVKATRSGEHMKRTNSLHPNYKMSAVSIP